MYNNYLFGFYLFTIDFYPYSYGINDIFMASLLFLFWFLSNLEFIVASYQTCLVSLDIIFIYLFLICIKMVIILLFLIPMQPCLIIFCVNIHIFLYRFFFF